MADGSRSAAAPGRVLDEVGDDLVELHGVDHDVGKAGIDVDDDRRRTEPLEPARPTTSMSSPSGSGAVARHERAGAGPGRR